MPRAPLLMLLVFALTLFTSATLLFMVEPMIGKMILPLLGGTPAVWNTCMVFFQAVLLLGYLYAHLSTIGLGARRQAAVHLVLLALPFVFLPIFVNDKLIRGGDNPVPALLLILTLSVGVPMFVVSASAPLLQKWFADTSHPAAKDPYFLYGASNLGSMLSLAAYPLLVEPYLRLKQQSFDWTIGYGGLVALTAACAAFLWLAPKGVAAADKNEAAPPEELAKENGFRASEAFRKGRRERAGKRPEPVAAPPAADAAATLGGEVTGWRVLRWVALAFVPSSLMLGATTYITTDIAAIPLLWVVPLALYLLSFILVFSRLPRWVHQAMVLMMPLAVLGLLFFMLSGLSPTRHGILWNVAAHLFVLFLVSMVCHGELARDRPAPRHLTGYFLWMSVGGVLGGLFNGLLAPVIFTGIVEYELALLLACLLVPPLGPTKESSWGRRIDLILAGLFVGLGVLLIALRWQDHDLAFGVLRHRPWPWLVAVIGLAVAVAAAAARRAGEKKLDAWLDLLLPLTLGLFFLGLLWGVQADLVWPRVAGLCRSLHLAPKRVYSILAYGVPIVLTYTFIERPLRFGMGIGAVLLAAGFSGMLDEGMLYQTRSFFGVLQVSESAYNIDGEPYKTRSLHHGTTLHGMQIYQPEDRRDEPLTYYHRTGPIGQVMTAYNGPDVPSSRLRNLAVIGLGTGTMACYARPGQRVTFYDIDPVVRRISFDEDDPYFTYVADARARGARVDLVMGDARLTMERQQLSDSEKYGVVVVDAFSSDAIPVHLITLEAVNIYLDKMTEDGLLCFHVSNRHLDLRPVLHNLAEKCGLVALYQSDNRERDPRSTALLGKSASTWVVLARKRDYLVPLRALNDWEDDRERLRGFFFSLMRCPDNGNRLAAQSMWMYSLLDEELVKRPAKWLEWDELQPEGEEKRMPDPEKVGVWTDDYSNLLSVFLW